MSSLEQSKLAFIGGGNMASAIISGLLAHGIPPAHITVAEPWDVNRDKVAALGVRTTTVNADAARDADVVVLAVKPQIARAVCEELAGAWESRPGGDLPTVLSVVAGTTLASLQGWLGAAGKDGKAVPVVRSMPNTPALVGEGAVGLFPTPEVTPTAKELIGALLGSISHATEWVEREELLDVVTGLSGSGPAYFFQMVEHMVASAVALGLPEDQATRLAAQTCLGAGKMMVESSDKPATLRQNVTSPNGTTYAALQTFERLGFKDIVDKSVKAATERATELGKQ